MLKHLYKTAFILAIGFLSLQNSNAQCPSANTIVRNDTICTGLDSATVFLSDVKAGAYYKAYLADQIIDSAIAKGTNLSLRVSTKKLSVGKNKLMIKASSAGCGLVTLKDSAMVTINRAPKINQVVIGDTICDNANFATVKIYGTMPGEIYQAFINSMAVSASFIAKTDTLVLTIPRSSLNLGFNTIHISTSIAGCAIVSLMNQATIMVNAIPMAMFRVTGDTICSNNPFAKITIMPTSKVFKYELSNGSGLLMNPFYGDSTKNFTVKNIPTSLLAMGANMIKVSTTFNMGVCGTLNLTDVASIVINPTIEAPKLKLTGDTVFITDKFAIVRIENNPIGFSYKINQSQIPDTNVVATNSTVELKIPVGGTSGLQIGTHKIYINATIAGCNLVTIRDSATIVVKPDPALSTENYFTSSSFAVYPNPFSSELYVSSKLNGNVKLQIVDALGNVMHQQTVLANEEIKINADLKNGLYFLQMESEGKRELVKLIKQ